MDNQYYPGNQTHRSTDSGSSYQVFHQRPNVSQPVVTRYIYPQQELTPQTSYSNNLYSGRQLNKGNVHLSVILC